METKVLKIDGMNCDHCKKSVTDALNAVEGVNSVVVDLKAGSATVAFDPSQASQQAMKQAVEAAGFEIVGR